MTTIKTSKHIRTAFIVLILLIAGITLLLNSPRVQQRVGVILASELENTLGARVNIGHLFWRFPNDIVVDSLEIDDQEGELLLSATRIAAKMEWMPLLKERRISICNIRLFNPKFNIYQPDSTADANYQFLIDAFSKKEKKEASRLNLRINSLLVRHAHVQYHALWKPQTPELFNPHHLNVQDLSTHISLKTLTNDSISVIMRQLNFHEASGFHLDDLYFRFVGNHAGATLANFQLKTPHSKLSLDTLWVNYQDTLFLESLKAKGGIRPSYITPADFSCFEPSLKPFCDKLRFQASFSGTRHIWNLKDLTLCSDQQEVALMGNALLQLYDKQSPYIRTELKQLSLSAKGWKWLATNIPTYYTLIPPQLKRLGAVALTGNLLWEGQSIHFSSKVKSDAGRLQANATLLKNGKYTLTLLGQEVHIGEILANPQWGKGTAQMEAEGYVKRLDPVALLWGEEPHPFKKLLYDGTLTGEFTALDYRQYAYTHLPFQVQYNNKEVVANLSWDDPNGKLQLYGSYEDGDIPNYRLDLYSDSLNLHALHLINTHPNSYFGMELHADVSGKEMDELVGKISIDSLKVDEPDQHLLLKQFSIHSLTEDGQQMVVLQSDFMEGYLTGYYSYKTLANSTCQVLRQYLPSLCNSYFSSAVAQKDPMPNSCSFNVRVFNTHFLNQLLDFPLEFDNTVTLSGGVFDERHSLSLSGNLPHLIYKGNEFQELNFQCENSDGKLEIYANGTTKMADGTSLSANIIANASNDILNTGISWNSEPAQLFQGKLFAVSTFSQDKDGKLAATIRMTPGTLTLNQAEWRLNACEATIRPHYFTIRDFLFQHDQQHIELNGSATTENSDSLIIGLKNINLGYMMEMARLNSMTLGGTISGNVCASMLLSPTPHLDANLNIQEFEFCNSPIGNTQVYCSWDNEINAIRLNALGRTDGNKGTHIHGHITPQQLDLTVDADSTNIFFLNTLLKSLMTDLHGYASGCLRLFGPLKQIDMEGSLYTHARFELKSTNVQYHFADSIRFRRGAIELNQIPVYDKRNHPALIDGIITHQALKNFGYNLNIDVQNTLGLDIPSTDKGTFYSTIYGTGKIHIYSAAENICHIDIDAETQNSSIFALNVSNSNAKSNEFITIVDRNAQRETFNATPQRNSQQSNRRRAQRQKGKTIFNIKAHITPQATVKLVMDQTTNDNVVVYGNGDLQIEIDGEDISIFGSYSIDRGSYTLSLQNVVKKDFELKEGSSIYFDGDPMTAILNVSVLHAVNSVALSDLSADATSMGNVRVNCILNITGTPNSPHLSFDLELPQGTEEEKSLLRSYTSTEEQMNLQFIYLLGLGKFYTYDYAQMAEGTQGSTNTMESLISSTLSGQINSLLSNIINNDNWNFASNFRTDNLIGTSTTETANSYMEVEGILEGRLLNNRLLVNGKFGYRDNPIYASNFIGDFDIQYLLTPKGTVSVKGYNKTNDRYFSRTSLTTQGVGIILKKEFDSLFPIKGQERIKHNTDSMKAD